jgi:hypothetical protein
LNLGLVAEIDPKVTAAVSKITVIHTAQVLRSACCRLVSLASSATLLSRLFSAGFCCELDDALADVMVISLECSQ